VLHDVDLEIPFGQTVVLVGENGCGKTTLINLLARFYDPVEGDISWTGSTCAMCVRPSCAARWPWSAKSRFYFAARLGEHLLRNPQASREEVLRAAQLGLVEEYVHRLPQGYETQVGDQGRALSGGPATADHTARAIVANPRILILDEATSQIDRDAELQVHESLAIYAGANLAPHHAPPVHRRIGRPRDRDGEGQIVGDLTPAEYLRKIGPEANAWREAA